MRQLLVFTVAAFLFMLCGNSFAAEPTEPTSDAVLESISYEKDADNAEKIIFKLNGAHIPKVFKIKGERPRLVFDFIDTRYSDLINRIIDTEGNLVEGVRVGIHNDPPKTRVVIDLKREGDFKFEQDFIVRENTLSITFHPNESAPGEPSEQAGKPRDVPPAPAPAASSQPQAPQPESPMPAARPDPFKPAAPAVSAPSEPDKTMKETAAAAPVAGAEEKRAAVEPETDTAVTETAQKDEPPATPPPAAAGAYTKSEREKEAETILASVAPADPVLRDVSFETTADNSEMVLFKLNDFYPPIVFGIEKGNPRVVCDFLDTALDKGVRSSIDTKGNYISGIRVARHGSPNKVRVVLDLVPNRNYDLQQVFFKEDNLFIIIINEFEEEAVPAADLTGASAPTP